MVLGIKTKKYLLASGCSYTDPNYTTPDESLPKEERGPWPMWPELMGSDLGLDVLNVGEVGNSNNNIYNSVINAINNYESQINTVAVLWSGWDRTELFHYMKIQPIHHFIYYSDPNSDKPFFHLDWVDETKIGEFLHRWKNSSTWNPYLLIEHSTKHTLTLMQSLSEVCENRNIKYIFYQGVGPINYGGLDSACHSITGNNFSKAFIKAEDVLQSIQKSSSSKYLEKNKKHFIGWPFIPQANGHHFDSVRQTGDILHTHNCYYVSANDRHPNSEGQKHLSDVFLKGYREIYD